jgi:ribosome assembly protein YihI (activator of Der GTPase)
MEMENEVWSEIEMFLDDLRCSNVDRESYVLLSEMKEAEKQTKEAKIKLQQELDVLESEHRINIENYIEALKNQAFVAEKQAYSQGYVDCIQLLAGVGLLKKSPHIEHLIEKIKK